MRISIMLLVHNCCVCKQEMRNKYSKGSIQDFAANELCEIAYELNNIYNQLRKISC